MDALTKWSETPVTLTKSRLSLKQLVLLGLACVAALVASGYGYYWWTVDRFFQSTDDAYVGGDVTPISPHISGFVADIAVTDNEYVRAGQLLVRLDDRDVRAATDHAEAVLAQRTAALASLRAKYDLQQSAIQQAGADLNARTAQANFAKVDAERYRTLALSNYGSRQDAERTSALDDQARAAVMSAQAALTAAKQQTGFNGQFALQKFPAEHVGSGSRAERLAASIPCPLHRNDRTKCCDATVFSLGPIADISELLIVMRLG